MLKRARPLLCDVTASAIALAVVVASCQREAAPRDDAAVAESAPGPIADSVAHRVDGDTAPVLTPAGWGALRIGMTRAQVTAAAGEDANPEAVGGPEPEACDEFRPARAPEGLLVMIERDRLTRISLGARSPTRTDRGFGVGDSAAAVLRAYGPRATVLPHKYVGDPASYITVWTVAPPAPAPRGIVYETGADGRVMRIHAGGPSIQYVEGCL